jgi:ADP-ribose pyrophosphatase
MTPISAYQERTPRSIPPTAKKVFSGVLFDVYQWEQEQFDGTTRTFEMLYRRPGASVIPVLEGRKLLIEEDEQPGRGMKITFPGGQIEDGEDPEVGARREFLEETGYSADTFTLWQETKPVGKTDWKVYTYIARGCKKITEPHLDAGERIKVKEITFDELIDLAEHPRFQNKELVLDLVKAKYDPEERRGLEEALFG